MLTTAAVYGARKDLLVAPTIHWVFDDDAASISPTLDLRYLFSDGVPGGKLIDAIAPFATAGIGFTVADVTGSADADLLLDFGVGIEFVIDEVHSLVSIMRYNVLPDTSDDHFAWQVLGVQHRF